MIMPDTSKTVTQNVREHLSHKVGQTIVPKLVSKDTGETESAVNNVIERMYKAGRIALEKKVGRTPIYLVLPNVVEPMNGERKTRYGKRKMASKTNTLFTVESGVAIPTTAKERTKYPFSDMKKGDSFKFPAATEVDIKRVRAAANYIARKKKMSFLVKRVGKASARCWRVS